MNVYTVNPNQTHVNPPPWRVCKDHVRRDHDAMTVFELIRLSDSGLNVRQLKAKLPHLHPSDVTRYLRALRNAGLIRASPKSAANLHPTAVDKSMSPRSAMLASILGLETALAMRVRAEGTPTEEMKKAFVVYQKCKTLYLNPGSDGEARTALRFALINLIKAMV